MTAPCTPNVGTLLDFLVYNFGISNGIALAYEIQTTATARNPTWSWTGSRRAEAAIAAFKSA